MGVMTVLVPARFITMVGHFIACVLVFWSKGDNVRGGLPLNYSAEQYAAANASYAPRARGAPGVERGACAPPRHARGRRPRRVPRRSWRLRGAGAQGPARLRSRRARRTG